MNNEDKRLSKLYTELYEGAHASEEFRRKVRNMTESNSKTKIRFTFKSAMAVAAAIALFTIAGTAIASANKGLAHDYVSIVFNGEERKAAYEKLDDNMHMWSFVKDNLQYGVTVYGDFDPKTQVIYFEDRDNYVIASDSPNPELNLYTAIESSPYAEIIDEQYLKLYTNKMNDSKPFMTSNTPSLDKADGTADGIVWPLDSSSEYYYGSATTILSNGAVAEAWKDPYVEEEDEFEDNFNELPETLESMENNNNF